MAFNLLLEHIFTLSSSSLFLVCSTFLKLVSCVQLKLVVCLEYSMLVPPGFLLSNYLGVNLASPLPLKTAAEGDGERTSTFVSLPQQQESRGRLI